MERVLKNITIVDGLRKSRAVDEKSNTLAAAVRDWNENRRNALFRKREREARADLVDAKVTLYAQRRKMSVFDIYYAATVEEMDIIHRHLPRRPVLNYKVGSSIEELRRMIAYSIESNITFALGCKKKDVSTDEEEWVDGNAIARDPFPSGELVYVDLGLIRNLGVLMGRDGEGDGGGEGDQGDGGGEAA